MYAYFLLVETRAAWPASGQTILSTFPWPSLACPVGALTKQKTLPPRFLGSLPSAGLQTRKENQSNSMNKKKEETETWLCCNRGWNYSCHKREWRIQLESAEVNGFGSPWLNWHPLVNLGRHLLRTIFILKHWLQPVPAINWSFFLIAVDYRWKDSRFPVSTIYVTFSNLNLLSSSGTGFISRIRNWIKLVSE